jgi:uncharacterized protein (TIRG00374 family)
VGIAAFLIYIYIFNVDIQEVIGTIQSINLSVYLLATVAAVLDLVFFTSAWYSLLRHLKVKVSLFKSFLFVWVGIFVDTLIPAESVSGELTKIYLVNREENGAAGKATASIVAQRLIGMGINIVTLAVGAALLLVESLLYGMILTIILFLIAVTFIFFALILLLCRREKWTLRIVDGIIGFAERISRGRWKLSKLREEVVEATKTFHVAMGEYAHAPGTLLVAIFFSAISWMLALGGFYLTFVAIGYPQVSWSAILVISSIFVAVKAVPVGIPFEVGLPEITMTFLLSLFGVPVLIGATATILMRVLTLWLRFFVGFLAQQWMGIHGIVTGTSPSAGLAEAGKS